MLSMPPRKTSGCDLRPPGRPKQIVLSANTGLPQRPLSAQRAKARAAQQAAEAAAKAQAEQGVSSARAAPRLTIAPRKQRKRPQRPLSAKPKPAAQQAAEAATKAQAEQRRVEREQLEADHRAKEAEKKAAEAAERKRARIDAERRAAEHEEKGSVNLRPGDPT